MRAHPVYFLVPIFIAAFFILRCRAWLQQGQKVGRFCFVWEEWGLVDAGLERKFVPLNASPSKHIGGLAKVRGNITELSLLH